MGSPLLIKKSTIVRFILAGGAALVLGACANLPQPEPVGALCPPPRLPVCEAFGTEHRCSCADRAGVGRALAPFGLAAPPASERRW